MADIETGSNARERHSEQLSHPRESSRKLKPVMWTILTLAVNLALLTLILLILFYKILFPRGLIEIWQGPCESVPKPHLSALAGEGKVILTWSFPKVGGLRLERWQYEQSKEEGTEILTHGTKSESLRYVVPDLTNGLTYWFRVRPILESGQFGCWSNRASAVPRKAGDALDAVERLQKIMADHASAISAAVAANKELVAEHGKRAVRAAEKVVASTEAIAKSLADIEGSISDLSGAATVMGNEVAAGFARIEQQLAKISGGAARVDFCEREKIGSLYFTHGSHSLTGCGGNAGESGGMEKILGKLNKLEEGSLIVVEGHSSAIGSARYNLHLSDERAACAIQCLRGCLDKSVKLKFRALAVGEGFERKNPLGQGCHSRRVDVFQCTNLRYPDPFFETLPETEIQLSGCGCST